MRVSAPAEKSSFTIRFEFTQGLPIPKPPGKPAWDLKINRKGSTNSVQADHNICNGNSKKLVLSPLHSKLHIKYMYIGQTFTVLSQQCKC